MPDSFSPFLNRSSLYLDEGIVFRNEVPYASNKIPDLTRDSDVIQNMLNFLDNLDLENNAELLDVANLREDLLSPDKLKQEIAQQIQSQSKEESSGSEMGEESSGEEGSEEGGTEEFTF